MAVRKTEIAWAAGFYDGEGSTSFSYRPEKRYRHLRLSISQVNRANLERFYCAVGKRGHITGPYSKGNGRKPICVYRADKVSDIEYILTLLWTFLSQEKKDQGKGALVSWYEAGRSQNISRKRPYGDRVPRIALPCWYCGVQVMRTRKYVVHRKGRVHCSRSCAAKSAAKSRWKGKGHVSSQAC